MKKRILSLVLCLCIALSCVVLTGASGSYNTNFEMNHLRIKVNVYDQDEAVAGNGNVPVPGVQVGINRHTKDAKPNFGNTKDLKNIITLTADENGVAYVDIPFTVVQVGASQMIYLNGVQNANNAIFDSMYAGGDNVWYDLESISSGYYTDVSKSGFIRDCINGANGGEIVKGSGAYDDFKFDGGIVRQWTYNFSNENNGDPKPAQGYGGGAFIEFNLYVKAKEVTVTYENDHIQGFDASQYPSETVKAGEYFTEPSGTPVHDTDTSIEFKGWKNKATGEVYDFTKPASSDVTLVPKWYNPNIAGYIHLDSYLWNHDQYNGSYGSGQTNTPVRKLKYDVVYYDQKNAKQNDWYTLKTVEVDENGQLDFVITAEELQILKAFRDQIALLGPDHRVAIDIGPNAEDYGYNDEGIQNNYAWDWIMYDVESGHGAGVTGVRTMKVNVDGEYNLNRDGNWQDGNKGGSTDTPLVGNVQFASNENHVPWLTQSMLDDGFEIWWKCYVASSMIVHFDTDGGTGAGDYSDQKYKPINSMPEARQDYLVKKPVNDPAKAGAVHFIGWYKVTDPATGAVEGAPWDFAHRIVTESMTLKALYADNTYRVTFKTPENDNQSAEYIVGGIPAWNGPNPTKTADAQYTYEFSGWKEIQGTRVDNTYNFTEIYDFDHQSRTISGSDYNPVTVLEDFAAETIYEAQFNKTLRKYTVKWVNWNDALLEQDDNVSYGTTPTYDSATPTRTSENPAEYTWEFTGWAPTVVPVTGDATYKAQFQKKYIDYTVTWVNDDGTTVLAQETYHYGEDPTYKNDTPVSTKTPGPNQYYEFVGWEPVISPVTGNATYKAKYELKNMFVDLTVTKTVTNGSSSDTFEFTLQASGMEFSAGTGYTVDASDKSKVTFTLANGGSITFQVYPDSNITVTETDKTGYAATSKIGSTTGDKAISFKMPASAATVAFTNKTLYNYKLNFDKNCTDTVNTMPATKGPSGWIEDTSKTYQWSEVPTRTGYTFEGWATTADGTGAKLTQYTLNGVPAQLKEVTLYALWTKNIYDVTGEIDHGTVTNEEQSVEYLDTSKEMKFTPSTGYTITDVKVNGESISFTPAQDGTYTYPAQTVTDDIEVVVTTTENKAKIEYFAVTEAMGSVSLASEDVPVVTGTPAGSTASAKPGFHFIGWFTDAECTVPVTEADGTVSEGKFTPAKGASGLYESEKFYAKFEESLGSLKVTKAGKVYSDDSFIFHITSTKLDNEAHDPIDMYVTVKGTGSVTVNDLPIGEYKVEECGDWSWRYQSDGAKTPTVVKDDTVEATITNTVKNDNWLSGADVVENKQVKK